MFRQINIPAILSFSITLPACPFYLCLPMPNIKANNLLVIRNRVTGQKSYVHCPLRLDVGVISKVVNSIARCVQSNLLQKRSGGRNL